MRLSIIAVFLTLFSAPATEAFAPVNVRQTCRATNPALNLGVDFQESAQRNVPNFEEWAVNCGVQRADGVQLTSADGLDWEVMTNSALPAGQPVMVVPANMVLSSGAARMELEAMSDSAREAGQKLSNLGAAQSIPKFFLTLKLLVEYQQGDQSPFFPWLDSLPRLYYNSVSMTDFCYECLPPLVFRLSREERTKFDNIYQALQQVDLLGPEIKENKELCKWAFNAVHTRCQGEKGQEQKIALMADMFNHATETDVEVSFDEAGNCNVFTTRDVPAGAPLRMSYGCPTNPSNFFATYGFLDESSPATFCKMMDIRSTPQLVDLGFDFSRMLFYKNTGEISAEVWDVVLYDKVLKNNIEVREQFYQAHMSGNAEMKQAIHQAYMLQTATAIKNHVDTFLEELDKLNAKGVGMDLSTHPRLPLIWRHNEFVKQTFLNVKANLDPMVQQAMMEQGALV